MTADRGSAYPWGDILPAVRGADCFLINLECALTDHTERWSDGGYKPFYFRANPREVETLQLAGVDFRFFGLVECGDGIEGREGCLTTGVGVER